MGVVLPRGAPASLGKGRVMAIDAIIYINQKLILK